MELKHRRESKRWTQGQLSLKSGVSRISISRYESGQREPTLTIAAKLAAALNCSVDDLVERKEES